MRKTVLLSWVLLAAAAGDAQAASCAPTVSELCLFGRYTVEVTWLDSSAVSHPARAQSFPTDDAGYFWFDDARYPEVVVKMINGCSVGGFYWVFFAALTDAQYILTVTDAGGTETKSYVDPGRTVVTDTMALDTCTDGAAPAAESVTVPPPEVFLAEDAPAPLLAPCASDATTLCLLGDRFEVVVDWMNGMSGTGMGQAEPVTSHSGAFWFFSPSNLELVVKIVETCPAFEVHFAGFTDLEYTLQVTDTATGAMQSYVNSPGSVSAVGDPTAFPRSCLFDDGFESGNVSAWSSAVGGP